MPFSGNTLGKHKKYTMPIIEKESEEWVKSVVRNIALTEAQGLDSEIMSNSGLVFPGLDMAITTGVVATDNTNPPKEEKKRTKKIIHFNGKDWMKCDQCGTMTSEVPCAKCGGSPVKDLDTLWNAETINKDEPKKRLPFVDRALANYDPGSYFQDGGVSLRGGDFARRAVW
jgi:hypothetical protein